MTTSTATPYTEVHSGIDSSVIRAVYYDQPTETLVVAFNGHDSLAGYRDVPRSTYRSLITAPSVGAFYNRNVKGQYPTVRVDSLGWRGTATLSDVAASAAANDQADRALSVNRVPAISFEEVETVKPTNPNDGWLVTVFFHRSEFDSLAELVSELEAEDVEVIKVEATE